MPREVSRRREELSARIKSYQGTRAARRRMEDQLENLGERQSLPLPPELMGIIFDFYIHLYGQLPEKLLLVCRAWHVLALSQPTLWANLDPLGPFGLTRARPWMGTFLQSRTARSNPAPLKIDLIRFTRDIIPPPDFLEKVAAIDTFLPRIQDLVINNTKDLICLVGDQPLLRHLTIWGTYPNLLDTILANPAIYKLSEKMLTTLHFRCPPQLQALPESLLRRLQTLGFWLTGDPGEIRECWSIVQKSTSLLALHVTIRNGNAPLLSHASCRNLTIAHGNVMASLEEVRMPRLQELHIVTASSIDGITQLTLVDTPISSLRLTCRLPWRYGEKIRAIHISWINGVIRFLRSAPRLEKFEISAPSGLVAGISEAFAEDPTLCVELNTFIINGPMGLELGVKEGARKRIEERFGQLRIGASTFIHQRLLRRSQN